MNKKVENWYGPLPIGSMEMVPPPKTDMLLEDDMFFVFSKGHYAICIFVWMRVVGLHSLELT